LKKPVLALLVFFTLLLSSLPSKALVYTYENGQTRVYVPLVLKHVGSMGRGQYMVVELYGAGACICPWASCGFAGGRIVLGNYIDIRLEVDWSPTPCLTGYNVKLRILSGDQSTIYETVVEHAQQTVSTSVVLRIVYNDYGQLVVFYGQSPVVIRQVSGKVDVYVEEQEYVFSDYVLRGGVNILDNNCGISHQSNTQQLIRRNPETFWDRIADAILGGLKGFSQIPTAITLVLVFVVIVALMALTARLRG